MIVSRLRSAAWLGSALALACTTAALAAPPAAWPTLDAQLEQVHAPPGSALAQLIHENQDFARLSPGEATDNLRVPPWLRVMWRKAHPETPSAVNDPSGGYPRVLNEILEWMELHPDLVPGLPHDLGAPLDATDSSLVGANVRISGAQSAARSESDIRVNPLDTLKVIGASNNMGASGRQSIHWSTDGGSNWSYTELPLASGDAYHSDPAVDWTSNGNAWSTTLGINNLGTKTFVRVYRSSDNGATWTLDGTPSAAQTGTDKELMWVDHSAASPYRNTIYVIWHNGAPTYVSHRTTGTWSAPLQISGAESSGTCIGSDIKTNSAGEVFAFWPTTGNSKIIVNKSTNGGVSFGTAKALATTYDSYDIGIPSFNGRRALIYASGGAYRSASKNMVYAAWTDLSGDSGCTQPSQEPKSNAASSCKTRIWFGRSTDGGTTWSTPVRLNHQAGLNDQFNQWLAVDESTGRVSVMYYDTVNDAARLKTDVYYQTSTDDGATWSSPTRVTTAMTDETGSGADTGNQYGDYNGLSAASNLFYPVWTDRRGGTREEIWTAKITESTPPPPAPGENGGLLVQRAGATLNLVWGSDCGAGATFGVYRGDLALGYASLAPEPGYCAVSGTATAIPLGARAADFFLVVPNNGATEGSYGTTSGGTRRSPAPTACLPQGTISACAP